MIETGGSHRFICVLCGNFTVNRKCLLQRVNLPLPPVLSVNRADSMDHSWSLDNSFLPLEYEVDVVKIGTTDSSLTGWPKIFENKSVALF